MVKSPTRTTPKEKRTITDVAAGGGVGGTLIFLANTYIADANVKTILIYCIPIVSILTTGCWSLITDATLVALDRQSKKNERKRAEMDLNEMRKQVKAIEDDPHASESHKSTVRGQLEIAEQGFVRMTRANIPEK